MGSRIIPDLDLRPEVIGLGGSRDEQLDPLRGGLISAKSVGCLSPRRCLRRPDSQGRKARRPAGKTWDQIRTDHRATSGPHPVDKVPKFQSSIIGFAMQIGNPGLLLVVDTAITRVVEEHDNGR